MKAPKCRQCGHEHLSSEPHVYVLAGEIYRYRDIVMPSSQVSPNVTVVGISEDDFKTELPNG